MEQNPFNFDDILRNSFLQELAQNEKNKQEYYSKLFGEDVIKAGVQEYGQKPFFEFLKTSLTEDPRLYASLAGNSGSSQNIEGLGVVNTPGMLRGQLGVEKTIGDTQVRAAMNNMYGQTPDGYKQLPKGYEAGLSMPLAGGELNMSGNYIPAQGMMNSSMYNFLVNYRKKF